MSVLTVVRVLGVQRYIFRSNRLRDAVAASQKIDWATDEAVREELKTGSQNKVLRSAGGEAVLLFHNLSEAKAFARVYSRRLYDECPGMEYIIEHFPFEPNGFARALYDIGGRLEKQKRARQPDVRQLGLSVTQDCALSDLPAVGFEPGTDGDAVSREILSLHSVQTSRRWEQYLPDVPFRATFPMVIDDLGRTRDVTSLVGVVHVDGNGIGEAIHRWLTGCIENNLPDEEVIRQYEELSTGISQSAEHAFCTVVDRVVKAIDPRTFEVTGNVPHLKFELRHSRGASGEVDVNLPLRPVVLAGDEMTFVCDGRLALSLADVALSAFRDVEVAHLGRVSASAGVAIVPARAPFYRTYELAASLCNNAKRERRRAESTDAWLDWYIGAPPPGTPIGQLRDEHYVVQEGAQVAWHRTCRPYPLEHAGASGRISWRQLDTEILGTDTPGLRSPDWIRHHNKLKEFSELVLEGPEGVKRGRMGWARAGSRRLPALLGEHGFLGSGRTPLVDAVELLDLHLPLGKVGDEHG